MHSSTSFDDYLENPVSSSFFLQPTSSNKMHDVFNNLKDGSNGHDNIDVIFAKCVPSIIMS